MKDFLLKLWEKNIIFAPIVFSLTVAFITVLEMFPEREYIAESIIKNIFGTRVVLEFVYEVISVFIVIFSVITISMLFKKYMDLYCGNTEYTNQIVIDEMIKILFYSYLIDVLLFSILNVSNYSTTRTHAIILFLEISGAVLFVPLVHQLVHHLIIKIRKKKK